MSEVQNNPKDVSVGIGNLKKIKYLISFPAILGQSWRGQL